MQRGDLPRQHFVSGAVVAQATVPSKPVATAPSAVHACCSGHSHSNSYSEWAGVAGVAIETGVVVVVVAAVTAERRVVDSLMNLFSASSVLPVPLSPHTYPQEKTRLLLSASPLPLQSSKQRQWFFPAATAHTRTSSAGMLRVTVPLWSFTWYTRMTEGDVT